MLVICFCEARLSRPDEPPSMSLCCLPLFYVACSDSLTVQDTIRHLFNFNDLVRDSDCGVWVRRAGIAAETGAPVCFRMDHLHAPPSARKSALDIRPAVSSKRAWVKPRL